jgi:hypothetical protein
MKVQTGLAELILIVSMMVASIPLLCTLVRVCNTTQMDYLSDKTVYKVSDSVDWTLQTIDGHKVLVPTSLAPVSIDYGGAQILAIINDEYCPSEGRLVRYSYNTNSVFSSCISGNNKLVLTDDVYKNKTDEWKAQLSATSNWSLAGTNLYLVWNAKDEQWMITSQYVNIFEERK